MKMPMPSPAAVKLLEELAPVRANVTQKKVFGQPAAFVNGHMFLGVFGNTVFLRLSEADQLEAKRISGVVPFEPMAGHAMTGYFVFPRSVLENRAQSRRWVDRSLNFASGLPPKKNKRKGG